MKQYLMVKHNSAEPS